MFMNLTPILEFESEHVFILKFPEFPVIEFVELPDSEIKFCNLFCGVMRGALEMIRFQCKCDFVKDKLIGDDQMEMRVELLKIIQD